MKRLLAAAALAAAVPASAQVSADQTADIAAASGAMRALAARLAPAAVDPKPVAALADRLSRDGSRLVMEEGETGNLFSRRTPPDARGRFRDIQANLVELPAEAVEEKTGAAARDLVMRRYFSRLEATIDEWRVDPETGAGRVDEWHYVVSLDGKLISVEHTIVPVEPVAPGKAAPNEAKGRSYRMSPSDASVQRRWRKFAKELLTLGKTVQA